MRIDKYIWCVRLTKTRSQATDLVKKGKIKLNEEDIKPSREVKPKDTISVLRHNAKFEYQVLDFPKSRVGAKLVADLILDITKPEEVSKYELYRESQATYRHYGTGKPTKKDRRDLDEFWDDFLDF
jgi:ribosome-associated heat shock protein Hsp15